VRRESVSSALFYGKKDAFKLLSKILEKYDNEISKAIFNYKRDLIVSSLGTVLQVLYIIGFSVVSESEIHEFKLSDKTERNIAITVIKEDRMYKKYLQIMKSVFSLEKKLANQAIDIEVSKEEKDFIMVYSHMEIRY